MSENIINTIYLAGVFVLLFASAELFFHIFKIKAEFTRRYVHLATGLLTMLFPPYVQSPWLVGLLCASFLLILLISLKFDLLKSINGVDRETRGSILFPMIVFGCFMVFHWFGQYVFYYIPILILAICDPVAALVGKRYPIGKYTFLGHTKTLSGSFGFFVIAMLLSYLLLTMVGDYSSKDSWLAAILISVVTVIAEAVSHKGYDNLTIPASAIMVLLLLTHFGVLI